MHQKTHAALKVAYCLVLLNMVFPFGLAQSGWVSLAMGGFGGASFISMLAFLALGLYRIYLVARVPDVLDSNAAPGFEATLINIGKVLLYVGSIVAVLSWVAGPLMHAFVQRRTESGVEYFVVGMYLAMAGGIGKLGLFLFEFGRLRAFERTVASAS